MTDDQLAHLVEKDRLTDLEGIGSSTGTAIAQAARGEPVDYLERLEADGGIDPGEGADLLAALRGDCHAHSVWSDGGATIEAMARAAQVLGHDYLVMTDHSPRLTVAHGLSAERLREQLDEIDRLNAELAPFRILTGIEVDIFEDGTLDQDPELLAELDLVVASVHSKFRLPRDEMTRRMVLAVSNPHVDVLGHCTNRKVVGPGRPPSDFDAEIVFAGLRQVRHGRGDQLPPGAPGSPRGAAVARRRVGLRHRHRHRRPRPRPARVARLRPARRRPDWASPPTASSTPERPMNSSPGLRDRTGPGLRRDLERERKPCQGASVARTAARRAVVTGRPGPVLSDGRGDGGDHPYPPAHYVEAHPEAPRPGSPQEGQPRPQAQHGPQAVTPRPAPALPAPRPAEPSPRSLPAAPRRRAGRHRRRGGRLRRTHR